MGMRQLRKEDDAMTPPRRKQAKAGVKAWAVVNYANQVMPFNAYWGSLRIYTNKRSAGIAAKQELGDSKRIEQVMILRELQPRRSRRRGRA